MTTVRIPGAESIQEVAVARDPGVTATPDSFGAGIGESLSKLGNTAVEVGALLDRKREAAAAAMALPEATAKFQLAAVQRQQKLATEKPTSAAATGQQVDADLTPVQDQTIAETKAKYGLNDLDAAKITGHLTTLRGHAVVSAVTSANNQIVTGLTASHDDTVKNIGATALATGDVDGALKQVDQSVAALRGVVPENDLNARAAASKKVVVDSVIAGLRQSGTKEAFDRAEQLTQRFYGTVPEAPGSKLPPAVGTIIDREARAAGVDPALARRVAQIESGGNPNAATGSYSGLFQLSAEGFAANGGKGSITDPVENTKAGIASLKRDIDAFRAKYSREPSATEIYLSHQQGQGGLAAHLANPDAPAWANMASTAEGRQKGEAWAKQAIWGNIPDSVKAQYGSVDKVTSRDFFNIWKQKVEGGPAVKPEMADPEKALFWNQQINAARTKTLTAAAADTENQYTRQIIDASAGVGPLPSRSAIESNTNIGEDTRNKLLAQYDSAASDVIKLQSAMKRFTDGGSFNPFDKDDKANVDRIYNSLGGDIKALEIVTNRTGMVPEAAVTGLRGAMVSSDPAKVEQALQVSANLVGGKYPDVFANVKGGEDLTKTANTFRHYVYDRGMTAAAATAKIIEERTPEYEQRVKARIKPEDVNDIVKKQLKDSDIRNAFDDSWIPFNDPKLTFNPEMRQRAMGDYEEAFRENFAKTGDVSLSKSLALDEMKRTWGTTQVNGLKTVMKYPPERSPVYAGIENVSEHIAGQAVAAIKEWNAPSISSLPAADAALKLTPQERALYERHLSNLVGPGGVDNPPDAENPKGSRSTLFQTTVEHDGKFYAIPTVFDGKILWDKGASDPAAAAIDKVNKIGWDKFPAYKSEAEAEARYQQMHAYMEKDTEKYLANPKAFDVDRSQLRLDEVRNTAERYMRGQPPVYVLSYVDKNGHVQTIPKQFYADPNQMRDKQTAERAARSAKIQTRVDIDADNADLGRANFGVQ
ncbi:hypothetical protein CO683_00850 [Bradyrhizobium ottawaense]|uniref:transglycosylase SLT domain-containing protein n=1 Tax=Bradyrhizobium ottawaense TaxID=931866 RepID=UPI000BEA487E|nr:transglycosylase SLT domain-containing protein [Bradyrhizobium ottawaense]PDT71740.1 hypothetical protein CO683_00850 [Bradyrhizobium ottawaense]